MIGLLKAPKTINQDLARNLTRILDQCGLKKNNNCIHERWRVKFKFYDYFIKICCELWSFDLGRKFSMDSFWTCYF